MALSVTGTNFNMIKPASTDSPRNGDDEIRNTKEGFRERLNRDHDFTSTTNTVDVGVNSNDADVGKHRKVTFVSVITTPEVATYDKGFLYAKTVSDKGELHWEDEDGQEVQLTSVGVLNITAAAIAAADTNIVDDDTITHTAGVLQLKGSSETPAASGEGIKYYHLSPDAGDLCDDFTIEIDGTNGLQIKAPSESGTDATDIEIPVYAFGSYSGNGEANRAIDAGIVIRHLVIKRTNGTATAVEVIALTAASYYAWGQEGGGDFTGYLTLSGTTFIVDNQASINASGGEYKWFAIGERATE